MIAIIDYGMGNTGSVSHSLEHLGANHLVTKNIEELVKADAYIFPGVGAFPKAMENIIKLNILDVLNEQVLIKKKPFFGICLGMQLLAKDSIEHRLCDGFGWIDGHVKKINTDNNLSIPHVGWNNIVYNENDPMYHRVNQNSDFYFDHSYYLECDINLVNGWAKYSSSFVASIRKDNIFATQFHPEKSQRNGLKLIRNFLNYTYK